MKFNDLKLSAKLPFSMVFGRKKAGKAKLFFSSFGLMSGSVNVQRAREVFLRGYQVNAKTSGNKVGQGWQTTVRNTKKVSCRKETDRPRGLRITEHYGNPEHFDAKTSERNSHPKKVTEK